MSFTAAQFRRLPEIFQSIVDGYNCGLYLLEDDNPLMVHYEAALERLVNDIVGDTNNDDAEEDLMDGATMVIIKLWNEIVALGGNPSKIAANAMEEMIRIDQIA